ncbi:MAG: sugar phosphate isomerase/epimerase [Oliverpabstia sp.]|nr:sugar phosphate isomerase/epimerase [Oliverpabstia sp.]
MKRIPIAIQVYSVREEAEADFAGTMKKLAQMGYDGVELAGLYGKTAEEIKNVLDENNLTAVSAHVPVEELEKDMEGTLDTYASLGCKWIAIPWLGEDRRYGAEKYEETLQLIGKISESCKKRGIQLLYHNHDFEFKKTPEGVYHLDQLYVDAPAGVLDAELDMCWVTVGGAEPCGYLKKYAGRCPLVHMKDFRREDEKVILLPLGDGVVDIKTVAKTGIEGGAQWFVIEQDDHHYGKPMDDMEKGLHFLEKCLED